MSALPEATRGYHEQLPPTASGLQRSVKFAIASTSLYEGDMLASLFSQNSVGSTGSLNGPQGLAAYQPGNSTQGGRWITFQPRSTNCELLFASASGQVTSTVVATNGIRVLQDTTFRCWITQASRWVEAVGDAAGTIVYWQSSPNYGQRPPGVQ